MAKCVVAVFENAVAKVRKNMLSPLFYYNVLTQSLAFVLLFRVPNEKYFSFLLWCYHYQQRQRRKCSKKVYFFCFCKFLKINGVLKKFKISSIFSLEMFCQFKNLPYLCTRFREATRLPRWETGKHDRSLTTFHYRQAVQPCLVFLIRQEA